MNFIILDVLITPPLIEDIWVPPPQGLIKMNCDASVEIKWGLE